MGLILSQFETRAPLKPVQGWGACALLHHYITAHDTIKPSLLYSCYWCVPAALKRLPVQLHSADYIFSGPLESLGSFLIS